ncbi:hypothetical protein ACQUQU_11145 [Thalassolituus sp. LLYu03]|uniref:hypothetical protein n=1 Tax=Thalassolituus sp. LLYu03 TaxID=3421656 RepID=UPI003D2846F6
MAVIRKLIMTLVVVVIAATQGVSHAVFAAPDMEVASMIRNATFLERTPEFTDLYIIKTWDKGRQIVIYCNSAYCYKSNGQVVTV